MEQNNLPAVATQPRAVAAYIPGDTFGEAFEFAQRVASMLAQSDMVPQQYKGNVANTMVALELAKRIGTSPLAVMQNMVPINGKPSWASTFLIAAVNSCRRFEPLRFDVEKLGTKKVDGDIWEGPKGNRTKRAVKVEIADQRCTAWTVPAGVQIPLHIRRMDEAFAIGLPVTEGVPVTIEMAVKEGWYTKNDSKWPTMPDLMLRYRAAAFFSRLHCPEITMGMHDQHEAADISNEPLIVSTDNRAQAASSAANKLNEKIRAKENQPTKSNDTAQDAQVIADNTAGNAAGNAGSTSGDIL